MSPRSLIFDSNFSWHISWSAAQRLLSALSLCAMLCMTSCGTTVGRSLEELAPQDPSKRELTVGRGDTLMIQVWGEPRLSGEVYVRDDGRITVPLIGELVVTGKTLPQVTDEITKQMKTYVPGASVAVSVAQRAPIRYYLSGTFIKPGEYRSDAAITFLQAVATGGGFAPFADESSITLIRKSPTADLRYQLDYNRVIDGKEPNPELKDGDIIAVK
jgi:polysaccharide biosynthesis/export protein